MWGKAPEGVLGIPGLRPKRMRKLYTDLGIASVEALEEAVRTESQAESLMFLNFSASAAFVNGLVINSTRGSSRPS